MKLKKIATLVSILSLLISTATVKKIQAAPLTQVSDRLSSSNVSANSSHTIIFTNNTPLESGQYFNVILPAGFSEFTESDITCPEDMNPSYPGVRIARCTASASIASGSPKIIVIANVTNPATEGSREIIISSNQAGGELIESANVKVAIINGVNLLASVDSTLSFTISPLATSTDVNGQTTTGSSATTSLAFGTLDVGTSTVLGQEIRVVTNGENGYSVTLAQDGNLTTAGGTDIDSFVDGTSTNPQAWSSPLGVIDQEWTYGHFGFTTEDESLAGGDLYGNNLWKGLATTTPVEILYHNGPSDGSTPNKGYTKIGYRLEISPLQETGDYTNVLTYIATPSF